MALLPRAQLVVHPRGARHMADPRRLVAGSKQVYGEALFSQLYGEIRPVPAERMLVTHDGMWLELEGRPLELIHTEGHARHHQCIVDPDGAGVFTGDSFGVSYRELDTPTGPFIFPTTTPVHFDPEAAHATIERILARDLQVAYLTHFSRVDGLARLGADLHADLDAFVGLTETAVRRDDPDDWLETAIRSYLCGRLRDQGYPGPADAMEAALQIDATLNAQGLLWWWRHRRVA